MVRDSLCSPVVPWTIRDAIMGLGLVVLGTIFGLVVLSLLTLEFGSQDTEGFEILVLCILPMVMIVTVWMFAVKKYKASWQQLGFVRAQGTWDFVLPWVVFLASLTFGGLYSATMNSLDIKILVPEPAPASVFGEGSIKIIKILLIGGMGPFAEELFFRGFLLAALIGSWGTFRAVIVSSTIFAACHGVLAVAVPIFVTGMLFAWLYLKTRSIWPPFMAHAAQNVVAIAVAI